MTQYEPCQYSIKSGATLYRCNYTKNCIHQKRYPNHPIRYCNQKKSQLEEEISQNVLGADAGAWRK